MSQSYVNLRFEQIEKRFNEIEILLNLANDYRSKNEIYQSLCRSAHVLLVSHFEGLYRELPKDAIDDINSSTKFYEVKKVIFTSFSEFFITADKNTKAANTVRNRLYEALKDYPSKLRVEPFVFFDNRNPTPKIIETILEKFGIKNFFWSLEGSDLDIAFQGQKSKMEKLRNRLHDYVKSGTSVYPYFVDRSFYKPVTKENEKIKQTLWEDFINNFLRERHNIVHGHVLDYMDNHESLLLSKMKIEILLYAFIVNLCWAANPLFLLPERNDGY